MNKILTIAIAFMCSIAIHGQDLLSSVLGDSTAESMTKDPVFATFKTTRIVNLPSIENTAAGVFDFKISHRFGFLNSGSKEFFGLDQAYIRLGGEYGITPALMVGVGRSSYQKVIDGYAKLRLIRQKTNGFPFTVSLFGGTYLQTLNTNPDRQVLFTDKLSFVSQLLIGTKISDALSLQVSPTLVHRNLTATTAEKNDVYAIGAGGRIKLTKRISFNGEYIYVLPNQISTDFKNSLSLGFDIETGGHVFQLHLTNSTSMIEKGFVAENAGDFGKGDIHFGFNISRVFTIVRPKEKK